MLILPLIDHADFIYEDSAQYNMHLLHILQNNASCRILRADYLTHVADLHTRLKIDYLNVRRKKHILTWVSKILNGLAHKKLDRFFTRISEMTQRVTRYNEGDKLYIEKPMLELTKKSFRYRGATLWNSLPEEINMFLLAGSRQGRIHTLFNASCTNEYVMTAKMYCRH